MTEDNERQQRTLRIIDEAGVPTNHFKRPPNRNPKILSFENNELARFSEMYVRATQGDITSIRALGLLYYNGDGPVLQNYKEAVKWLRYGEDMGDGTCKEYLGRCYFEGWGVQKDHARSRDLLKEASRMGRNTFSGILNYLEGKMPEETSVGGAFNQDTVADQPVQNILDLNTDTRVEWESINMAPPTGGQPTYVWLRWSTWPDGKSLRVIDPEAPEWVNLSYQATERNVRAIGVMFSGQGANGQRVQATLIGRPANNPTTFEYSLTITSSNGSRMLYGRCSDVLEACFRAHQ